MTCRLFVILASLMLAVLAGCGYRAVGYDALYRQDVQTVAVPVVSSTVYDPDLTDALTAALVREIEASTPYRVADVGFADTILAVELESVGIRGLSRSRATGLPEQQLLTVTSNFTWRDVRSGKELLRVDNFVQTAQQFPTLGEGRFTPTQESADELAAGIVDELARRW